MNKDDNHDSGDSDNGGERDIFSDLRFCLGDIMPAIRDKYPKKQLFAKMYSKRSPNLTLSAENNGWLKFLKKKSNS